MSANKVTEITVSGKHFYVEIPTLSNHKTDFSCRCLMIFPSVADKAEFFDTFLHSERKCAIGIDKYENVDIEALGFNEAIEFSGRLPNIFDASCPF